MMHGKFLEGLIEELENICVGVIDKDGNFVYETPSFQNIVLDSNIDNIFDIATTPKVSILIQRAIQKISSDQEDYIKLDTISLGRTSYDIRLLSHPESRDFMIVTMYDVSDWANELYSTKLLLRMSEAVLRGEDIDTVMDKMLPDICRFAQAEEAYVFGIDKDSGTISKMWKWATDITRPSVDILKGSRIKDFIKASKLNRRNKGLIYVKNRKDLGTSPEREVMAKLNVKSALVCTFGDEYCNGGVGIDSTETRIWEGGIIELLRRVAQMCDHSIKI